MADKNLTLDRGEMLNKGPNSKNKDHSSELTRMIYYKTNVPGRRGTFSYKMPYWEKNGTRRLFEDVRRKAGGRYDCWRAVYAGKVRRFDGSDCAMVEFFQGELQAEGTLMMVKDDGTEDPEWDDAHPEDAKELKEAKQEEEAAAARRKWQAEEDARNPEEAARRLAAAAAAAEAKRIKREEEEAEARARAQERAQADIERRMAPRIAARAAARAERDAEAEVERAAKAAAAEARELARKLAAEKATAERREKELAVNKAAAERREKLEAKLKEIVGRKEEACIDEPKYDWAGESEPLTLAEWQVKDAERAERRRTKWLEVQAALSEMSLLAQGLMKEAEAREIFESEVQGLAKTWWGGVTERGVERESLRRVLGVVEGEPDHAVVEAVAKRLRRAVARGQTLRELVADPAETAKVAPAPCAPMPGPSSTAAAAAERDASEAAAVAASLTEMEVDEGAHELDARDEEEGQAAAAESVAGQAAAAESVATQAAARKEAEAQEKVNKSMVYALVRINTRAAAAMKGPQPTSAIEQLAQAVAEVQAWWDEACEEFGPELVRRTWQVDEGESEARFLVGTVGQLTARAVERKEEEREEREARAKWSARRALAELPQVRDRARAMAECRRLGAINKKKVESVAHRKRVVDECRAEASWRAGVLVKRGPQRW